VSWIQALSWVKISSQRGLFLTRVSPLLGFTAQLPVGVLAWRHGRQQEGAAGGTKGCLKLEHPESCFSSGYSCSELSYGPPQTSLPISLFQDRHHCWQNSSKV